MKEKLEELYDGLKERLKSNFLLTFIIIWLLHHWRLIYSIFNFDSDKTLVEKRAYIANYIHEEGILWLWVFPLLWTFVSMISFYGFSSLSEILNIAYHNIRKSIYKKWDNKRLKTIEEFMEKVEENEKLQKMIKDLEQRRELLLGTNERLETSIGEHNKTIHNQRQTLESNREVIGQLNEKTLNMDKEIDLLKSKNENLSKIEEQVIQLTAVNHELEAEVTRLKNLMKYKAKDESTDIEDVFKKGEVWSLRYKDIRGNQKDERFKFIEPDKFVTINRNEAIKITQFHFDRNLKRVTFLKSNQAKGYTERYTKIFEFSEGYFVGKEEDLNVEYRKLN